MMTPCRSAGLLLLPMLLACSEDPRPSVEEDIAAIHEVRTELRRLTREGDVTGAMALFTEDAVYLRPGDPADIGKAALTAHWAEPMDELVVDVDYRAEEVEVSGDLAFVRGDLTFTGTPRTGDGASFSNEQRYLWVLRRSDDGAWRIARYIRHSGP